MYLMETNPEIHSLGCGAGLRPQHYPDILDQWPAVDWLEAISENYMDTGGRPLKVLKKIREHYPLALHGTSLSIGSADPLDATYLERLKKLADRVDPVIVSDHLCWSSVGGKVLHDLLPLPFTEESLSHVASRIGKVQDYLDRRILIENVSTYVTYRHSVMPEWEFLREAARRSGCGILLDLNNIYVNAKNHGFDPMEYIKNIPAELVGQFHLAGHTDMGSFLFDTHSSAVIDPVWNLYREALKIFGPVSTLIEWDEDIPPFRRLLEEVGKAKKIYADGDGRRRYLAPLACQKAEGVGHLSAVPDPISFSDVETWIQKRIQPATSHTMKDPEFLNPQGGVSGTERMSVYANGYLTRIEESLKEVYEAIRSAIAPEAFHELSLAYAKKHPSSHYNLNFAGRHLPDFLKAYCVTAKDACNDEYPFLRDLAELEWRIWTAFHAFQESPMDRGGLAQIPQESWSEIRLYFQPSVLLWASKWPVLDLWLARKKGVSGQSRLTPSSEYLLIARRDLEVRCERLGQEQYEFLSALIDGKTLGEACERLNDLMGDQEFPVSEWFGGWVQDGLITRCEVVSVC